MLWWSGGGAVLALLLTIHMVEVEGQEVIATDRLLLTNPIQLTLLLRIQSR